MADRSPSTSFSDDDDDDDDFESRPLLANDDGRDSFELNGPLNSEGSWERARLRAAVGNSGDSSAGGLDDTSATQPITTRRELWSYYLYYNGDSGVGPRSYSQALFQYALTAAGFDPDIEPPTPGNCSIGACVLPWGSGSRSVSSIILLANGFCFTIMTIILVWLGSAADYGSFGRWLLLAFTVICWTAQYGFMAVRGASDWPLASCLYILSFISYGATLVFYSAIFPRLAKSMPHVRAAQDDLKDGKIEQTEYDKVESLEKSHVSSISTAHSNIGYLMTLGINLTVLLPMKGNNYAKNWALFLTNTYWVALGIWWFVFQQHRPGPSLPKGSSYFTIGWKQVYLALSEIRHLPQTFLYLISFFLLADGLNTTTSLVSIIQNSQISFSFLQLTYLGICQAIFSIASTFGFWYIQDHFKISTKGMMLISAFATVFISGWGLLGIWTRIGYRNYWEFWCYNIFSGIFIAPYYAYSQTMMAEVTPPGMESMFFGLFGITNRVSSIIGPNVLQAIVNATNNNWMGFPFLVGICTAASLVICYVDVEKGREQCRRYAVERMGSSGRITSTE